MVGTISAAPGFRTFRSRALIFIPLILLVTILAYFPQRYRAAVSLATTDPASLGLGGALGQLGALNSAFGNQAAIEVALRVANGVSVSDDVITRLNLEKRLGKSRLQLHRWLEHKVDIRSLRGGIIIMEMTDRDPELAREIVTTFGLSTQDRLAKISRTQTSYKRGVLTQLTEEASANLTKAQSNYDAFRMKNRSPDPMTEVDVVSGRIAQLQGTIKAKQVAMQAALQIYTADNPAIRQMQSEIDSMKLQLSQIRTNDAEDDVTVERAIASSSALFRLERELIIQRTLYDSYLKFLQGTSVENLTSTANMRILEPPFVDPDRQVWWPAVASAIALILAWGTIEFYRLRPPVGAPIGEAL